MTSLSSSAWFDAATFGDLFTIQNYLTQGFDVQTPNLSLQHTALHLACQEGHLPLVQLLLSHGAAVNPSDALKQTPLHLACREGHFSVASELLSHGAQVNACDVDQWTSLHLACCYGHLEVARVLLDHDADLCALSLNEQSPLHLAQEGDHMDVVELLQAHRQHLTLHAQLTVSEPPSDTTYLQDASPDSARSFLRL